MSYYNERGNAVTEADRGDDMTDRTAHIPRRGHEYRRQYIVMRSRSSSSGYKGSEDMSEMEEPTVSSSGAVDQL